VGVHRFVHGGPVRCRDGDGDLLVGQTVDISLDSSEVVVTTEEVVATAAVEDVQVAAFRVPADTQAIVAVGGGVAIDYAKYAGFLTGLPVVAVPTAISNDGFAPAVSTTRPTGLLSGICRESSSCPRPTTRDPLFG